MAKHSSWYKRANMANAVLEELEVVDKLGNARYFEVEFEYMHHYTPPKIQNRPEDSEPPQWDVDWDPRSLVIREIDQDTGQQTAVAETLDPETRAEIEAQVDRWVRSDQAADHFKETLRSWEEEAELSRHESRLDR